MILVSTFKFFTIFTSEEKHSKSSSSQYTGDIKTLIHTLNVYNGLDDKYETKKQIYFF